MKWKIANASARGSAHHRSGRPNQDACEYGWGPDGSSLKAVMAVSDGHGGARHFRSQVGSALAVHSAITVVQEFVATFLDPHQGATLEDDAPPQIARNITEAWRAAVHTDFENNPFTTEEMETLATAEGDAAKESVEQDPLLAYGATLLVVAAADTFLLYMQLGDGDILAVDGAGETMRPIARDERLVGNQTTSLCQPDAWKEFRATLVTDPSQFAALVLASTDGYANSFRSEEDFVQIGRDYLKLVRENGIETLAEDLPAILAEASEKGSGDDITLGILQGDLTRVPPVIAPPAVPQAVESSRPPELESAGTPVAGERKSRQKYKILLILAMLASGAFFVERYRNAQVQGKGPVVSASPTPAAKKDDSLPPEGRQWVLDFGSSKIPLQPGHLISTGELLRLKKKDPDHDEPYAEIASSENGVLELINRSEDPWTVQLPGKKTVEPPVGKGAGVALVNHAKITFRSGAVATIVLVKSA